MPAAAPVTRATLVVVIRPSLGMRPPGRAGPWGLDSVTVRRPRWVPTALPVAAGGLVLDPPSGRRAYEDIAVSDVGDAAVVQRNQCLGPRDDLVAGHAVDNVADQHVLNR